MNHRTTTIIRNKQNQQQLQTIKIKVKSNNDNSRRHYDNDKLAWTTTS